MINYDDVRTGLAVGKSLPHFASQSGSSIREMESELQRLGFEPLKTLPAQYHNWLLQRSTDQERNGADCLDSVVQELNALLEEFNVTPTDALKNQIITLLKTNYPQEFLSTVFLKLTGGTVDGDLHVKGDLTVDGIGEEIISTELKVGADTITLRNGNPSAMSAPELAGVITENYDGNGNNNILAIDSSGTARVGDIDIATRLLYSNDETNFFEDEALTVPATIGQDETVRDTGNTTSGGVKIYEGTTFSNDNTEAIATRENNPTDGGVARWNDTAKRFDAVVPDAVPTANSQNLATSGGIFAAVAAASNNFILAAQGAADAQKTIDLPGGQISEGQTVTVNFKNGHAMIYNNPMTLNNILVVSNQNGTLAPIPLHAMTKSGSTVYKVLDANTVLELFYTANYDGNGTPAFVVVGNPLVLSSATYSIYANGYTDYFNYYNTGTVVYNYNNTVIVPQGGYTFSHEETVPSDGFYLIRATSSNHSETFVASNSTNVSMSGYQLLAINDVQTWQGSTDSIVIPLKRGVKLNFATQFAQDWTGRSIFYSFFMLKLQ